MITIDNLVQECCARSSHGLLQESKGGALTLTRPGWETVCQEMLLEEVDDCG